MKFLFYDTETTGLPDDYRAPTAEWHKWPRTVQLAFCVYDDEKDDTVAIQDYIIKPEGYKIPPESELIHGISHEKAMDVGVDIRFVLGAFWGVQNECDCLVAHNASFDGKILRADANRVGITYPLTKVPTICTMMSSTKWCDLPGKRGPKWPKLEELFRKCFNEEMTNAHNAMGDVAATLDCFRYLRSVDIINSKTWNSAVDRHDKIQKAVIEKQKRQIEGGAK